jgi:hypothetical protein
MQESLVVPNRKGVGEVAWLAFWQHVVHAQKASGLSLQRFCQQQGLPYSQSKRWRQRVMNKGDEVVSRKPVFVPVTLEQPRGLGSQVGIELYYQHSYRLVIPLIDGWCDVLKQLLLMLEACRC